MNYRVLENYQRFLSVPETSGELRIGQDDSILLVRLSAIGDVVRGLPVVQYLRSNGFTGKIGWAVQPPMDEMLSLWVGIDRVHPIKRENWPSHPVRLIESIKSIQPCEYDWVFDLHGLLKSAAVTYFSGGQRRVGFARENSKEFSDLFQDRTISPLPEKLPRILKYIQLLRPFTPEYEFNRSLIEPAEPQFPEICDEVESAENESPIVVHPCTSHSRYGDSKEWGREKLQEFLRRLEKFVENPIWMTWGPGERERVRSYAEPFGPGVRAAPKTPDLPHLVYLLNQARLVVSVDTSACHIADILGRPLVALFGSSDHLVSGPLLTDYRLITCRGGESETGDIPVDRVEAATRNLLAATEPDS